MILLKKLNSKGYTLIELMLAMGLFSVILVVSTIGFIGINRTYTRGVIKKQLSESIQKLSSDIETTLQIEPSSPVVFCSGADGPPNCTTEDINVLCFSGTRYYWPSHASPEGGLYKDSNICSSDTFDMKNQIVDSRYVAEDLIITPLPNELYRVRGIFHTTNLNALTLTTSDNNGDYASQRADGSFDPYDTKCKGSSAGSIVQTCAVGKFDFVINSRGNQV
jgi:prepilin-type N-terminal cleavage/methylation domain-containing protein